MMSNLKLKSDQQLQDFADCDQLFIYKKKDTETALGPSKQWLCPGHNLKEVSSWIKMGREEGGVCSTSNWKISID